MIPDSSFKVLSDMAYNIEKSKAESNGHLQIIEGSQIIDFHQKRSFMVLEVNDDINNGMQAMACQSLDESNHIVIAYSGTNAFNKKDILTDIDSVVLGKNNKLLTCPSSITLREDGISLPCKNPSQITTSKLFAQKIKMNYPDATLWLTGHSLGGYLAMIVASEMRLSARVFNSPSPINNMSEAATSYVISHPEKYHSYRINKDYIGNFGINSSDDKLGISKRVNAKKQHGFYKKIFFHE
ncbi:TPA: lipase family protein, partial [Streptococcus agalactiae]